MLYLNPIKCSSMLFCVKDKLQRDLVSNNITIRNRKNEEIGNVEIGNEVLGITFDNKLFFPSQLTSITKKVNIRLNNLTRVKKYIIPEQKTLISLSFIKSHFNYCPLIWMFCSNSDFHRLIITDERSLRLILDV